MANVLDKLINEELNSSPNVNKVECNNAKKSGLRTLCNIFIVLGYVLIIPSILFIVEFFDSEAISYLMTGIFGLAGCISCLFYGYVGKCLDDIRNNTKK